VVVVDVLVVDVLVVDVLVVDVVDVGGFVVTSVFAVPAQPNRTTPATRRKISLALIPSP
jgi:hypothetical protein